MALSEPTIRLAAFGGVLATLVVWELLHARRERAVGRLARWPANLALVTLNTLLVRVFFPLGAAGAALWAQRHGVGLFNIVAAPAWLALAASLLVLDVAIYAQHVAFHRVPVLWRLHQVHHTDLDVDVTTGVRFHPGEILLSMLIKAALVIGLGAPALSVVIFEVVLNATSMFNHANVGIPPTVDRALRCLIVTPDMHRIHHSIVRDETDSNFGFNVSWWDRLFRTYRREPQAGQQAITLGLPQLRDLGVLRLGRLLLLPIAGR
jgi:sterol desaturase/sphingolipid hydroxylase (fatty acid hydroxylase superfamily)